MADGRDEVNDDEQDDDREDPSEDCTSLKDPFRVETIQAVNLIRTLSIKIKLTNFQASIIIKNLLCGGVRVNAETEGIDGNDRGDEGCP